MTYLHRVALVLGLMSGGSLTFVSSSAEEVDFYTINEEAMKRHDAAMYQLVDELSDCASYYSILMNSPRHLSIQDRVSDYKRMSFAALGVNALTTLSPGSHDERLLEMEARILISQNTFLNTFGSLGGMAEYESEKLITSCEQLRLSQRRVFGWTNLRKPD